jgi:hypothetical protein
VTDYATALRNAYLDEVRGAAFFGALATHQPDQARREKLETLETVEARTVRSMERLLGQVGIKVEADAARREGRQRAEAVDAADWVALVRDLRTTRVHDSARFEQLRAAAPRPDDPALRALVNHAKALAEFAELEAAGKESTSLKPLTRYLRKPA